jgi:hypothetical protein
LFSECKLNSTCAAYGQYVTSTFAEHTVHKSTVFLSELGGNERLDGTCKSTTVNTASSSLVVKVIFGNAESERKSLLGNVLCCVYVLEELEA